MFSIIHVHFNQNCTKKYSTYKFLRAKKRNYKSSFNLHLLYFAIFKIFLHLLTTCSQQLYFAIGPIKTIINISKHNERLVQGKKKKKISILIMLLWFSWYFLHIKVKKICILMMLLWLPWYFLHISTVFIKKFVNGTLLALKIPISLQEFFHTSLPLQMIETYMYLNTFTCDGS